MALESESKYGVRPLTELINNLPPVPTVIRQSGLFASENLTTTYVNVASKDSELRLITAVPRGAVGNPVKQHYGDFKTFNMVHLPKNDVVLADDVQNLRAFGTDNKALAVNDLLIDKADAMKTDVDYSREHLQLGALQGAVYNADGTLIYDYNREFGVTRSEYTLSLSNEKVEIGKEIDDLLIKQSLNLGTVSVSRWIAFCSPEFLSALQYHPKVKDLYNRFADTVKVYREGFNFAFSFRGIDFVLYNHKFGTPSDIKAGEAVLCPVGTKFFKEYFAPANMNGTVNTKALPYYLSREKMKHDLGWELYAQSNPLPLVLRPKVCATLKMA